MASKQGNMPSVKQRRNKYSLEEVLSAVEQIHNKKSYLEVARATGIPKGSLHRFVKNPPKRVGAGRPRALTADEESMLIEAMKVSARANHPMDRRDLVRMVKEFFLATKRQNPFTNGNPGKDWLIAFEKRHPELSRKKPEVLQKNRVDMLSKEIIDEFFDKVYLPVLDKHKLHDKPQRILNLDEAGFGTDPTCQKVYSSKGASVSQVTPNSVRKSTTVLFCVSASGKCYPPLVVFKGKNLQSTWCNGGPKGAVYAVTDSGWMEATVKY